MYVLCPLSCISLLYQHFVLSYHNGLVWDLNVRSPPFFPRLIRIQDIEKDK